MRKYKYKNILSILLVLLLTIYIPLNLNLYIQEYKKDIRVLNKNYIELENYKNARLQDDFYDAVNKNWLLNAKLEDGCISYGTFEEVCGKVNGDILNIILDIEKNKEKYNKDSEELKILNLYNNYLDIDKRNELGNKPIEKYINKINEIKTINDFKELLSNNELSYFQPLINMGVGPDYKDSKINVLYISRSNLGLGNSLYYKDTSEKSKQIKNLYLDYIFNLYRLYGADQEEAQKNAQIFLNLENTIAQRIPSYEEEAKDEERIKNSYNVYNIKQLNKIMTNLNMEDLFIKMGIDKPNKIIVENPEELKLVNSLLIENNLEELKTYMKTNIMLMTDNYLTLEHRNAGNELRKAFYGIEPYNLDQGSGIKFINTQLNDLLGKLYVNKYFNEESKKDVENMASEIIKNFETRLKNNTWMSKATKIKALKKLETINVKIAYPEKWQNYKEVNINSYEDNGNIVENVLNIYINQSEKQFAKINKAVDKNEWSMGACTVNAYYNALNNEIVFPAGILQAPFYDKNASKEKNLGGIGTVIGHELTHAFDNTGAQFDEKGRLKNWWKESDYKEFTYRSKKVVDYYSKIKTKDGKFVNGSLTVGENISDLGGMACVLDIAKKEENPNLKDLFENYGAIWREISTKELKEYLLNNDPHSPKKIRVNAVLSQFEDFYNTYNVKEDDEMYIKPEDRIEIW